MTDFNLSEKIVEVEDVEVVHIINIQAFINKLKEEAEHNNYNTNFNGVHIKTILKIAGDKFQ